MMRWTGWLVLGQLLGDAAPAAAASARVDGFPTKSAGASHASGVTLADLNGDGRPEIIAAAGEGWVVVDSAGQVLPGFPVNLRQEGERERLHFAAAAAACDVDGDGQRDIAAVGSNGRLFVLRGDGSALSGFPVKLDGPARGPVTCVSKRDDVRLVVLTEEGSLYGVSTSGKARRIADVDDEAQSGVAVADLDGDGRAELVVGGGDAEVHVLNSRGKNLKGWPYDMDFRSAGMPAVGDINDDGQPDVVVASQDFKVHAIDASGKSLPGFPVKTQYRIYAGVALADLDGDGVVEIAVGSADGRVYAFEGDGRKLKGFPKKVDGRIIAGVIAADFDRDGRAEIAAVTEGGSLFVFDAKGRKVAGFPKKLDKKLSISPAAGDLDGDGLPELVAQSHDGALHAYRFEARGKAEVARVGWGSVGHSPEHTGRYGPNYGRFKELGFEKKEVTTTEPITIRYRFFDLDGDAETDTQIRWYRNDKLETALNNQRTVPAKTTRKHDRWRYTLQAGDNHADFGASGQLSQVFKSGVLRVRNTPPVPPGVVLGPEMARTTAPLAVQIAQPSSDVDSDTIAYRYVWFRDNRPQKLPLDTTVIPADRTRKNQRWRVVVVPFDGEEEGEPSSAEILVHNTAPGSPAIAVAPKVPGIEEAVKIQIVTPAPDDDRDPLQYSYRYWVDQQPLDLPMVQDEIPPGVLRKHTTVRVVVTAHDDQVPGGKVETTFKVRNTAPPAPQVVIGPAQPRTAHSLRLGILRPSRDADGDRVTLRHVWQRDGQEMSFPATVAPSETRKGQRWTLTVTPFDGEVIGTSTTVETVIQNTPPTRPLVILDDYAPPTDAIVRPQVVVASQDDDGDPITLRYLWEREGKPAKLPEAQTTLLPSNTRKHQKWRLRVVPNDGEVNGNEASLTWTIRNTPPTTPKVALTHKAPTTLDGQSYTVVTAAQDIDQDRLVYHHRWYRNGVLQEKWPLSKAKLLPKQARRNEHWRLEVSGYDGEVEGTPARVEFRVRNQAPARVTVALSPKKPTTTDDLQCQPLLEPRDADGDPVTVHTEWLRDGQPVDVSADVHTLPASLTHEKQKWACEVRVTDGELLSKTTRSNEVTVVNTPPAPPAIAISPRVPTTESELVCQLSAPSADPDVDRVSYSYRWRRNRKTFREPLVSANRIPADITRRGETWTCEVTPNDGEASGVAVRSQVKIQNTPPTPARARVRPERPVASERLACSIVESSRDADGDSVRYRFVWFRNGNKQSFAATSQDVPGRLVKAGDYWRCSVTPTDGKADGVAVSSQDVAVASSRRKSARR